MGRRFYVKLFWLWFYAGCAWVPPDEQWVFSARELQVNVGPLPAVWPYNVKRIGNPHPYPIVKQCLNGQRFPLAPLERVDVVVNEEEYRYAHYCWEVSYGSRLPPR